MLARLAECCQNDGDDDNDVAANYDSDDGDCLQRITLSWLLTFWVVLMVTMALCHSYNNGDDGGGDGNDEWLAPDETSSWLPNPQGAAALIAWQTLRPAPNKTE